MRYKIESVKWFEYNNDLLEHYPQLKQFPLDFQYYTSFDSSYYRAYYIHLYTMEDMNRLIELVGGDIIISSYESWSNNEYNTITIYDDYVE